VAVLIYSIYDVSPPPPCSCCCASCRSFSRRGQLLRLGAEVVGDFSGVKQNAAVSTKIEAIKSGAEVHRAQRMNEKGESGIEPAARSIIGKGTQGSKHFLLRTEAQYGVDPS